MIKIPYQKYLNHVVSFYFAFSHLELCVSQVTYEARDRHDTHHRLALLFNDDALLIPPLLAYECG